jgi:hypothetical protein
LEQTENYHYYFADGAGKGKLVLMEGTL